MMGEYVEYSVTVPVIVHWHELCRTHLITYAITVPATYATFTWPRLECHTPNWLEYGH